MNSIDLYTASFWGILVMLLTWLIQGLVASTSKASQKGAVPGKIDQSLSHDSFVFRSHRTFMNSLENLPIMLGTSFLAVLMGANVFWTGVFIWVFAGARIVHMVLYYAIATETSPSPRSYFFLLGLLSNICLLVLCGLTLV
ncbi:MAPEG family protein [Vibrio ruber DSM 16370]|uniref:MAPEG family protein n=1 Tax=Vibrio ruber (strain DSM 16370 / JCM 11486 / BCRC 17186 / CECT 7878 / LMG 23124 / VR1) TaxID=1123498 RepID=A0A1R4LFK2_VIBR1|nr:MAPEG family protein [Vibrio ruber]SJN55348.1 MAPEG family protein [Vibrio ruber DSM 16370]